MTKKRIFFLLLLTGVTLGSLLLAGCEDNTGPTTPTVQYRPQNFFLAVGDGHATVGNHNQSAAVTINWNGTPGENSPVPVHVSLVPHCDGIVDSHDNGAWDAATEVNIPLTPVSTSRDSGITNLKMKIVFNFQSPATAYFLLRWQDSTADIWKHGIYMASNPYPPPSINPTRQYGSPDWEEDWVCFIWDVWKKYHQGTGPTYFERQTANFQTQGCAILCHDPAPTGFNPMCFLDDSEGRTYSNPLTGETINASPILDVWFWGAGRTNCGDDPAKTSSTRTPSWIVDAQVTPGGNDPTNFHGIGPDLEGPVIHDEHPQFEVDAHLLPPYATNYDSGTGYPGKQRTDDPNSNQPYVWTSTASNFATDGWVVGSKLGGWISNPGLGKAANVQAQGVWEAGWWTVEMQREIDDGDENDSVIGTFNPH